MRVCPNCGYVEPFEWRPTSWKSGQYIDICRVSDLQNIDPELHSDLKLLPIGETVLKGHYAYRITRTGVWVQRRWIEIYKVQNWQEIPAEMHRKSKEIERQQKTLEG